MEFPYQSEDDPPDERRFAKTGAVCLSCILLLVILWIGVAAIRGHQKVENDEPIAADKAPAVETHQPPDNAVRKTVARSSRPKRRSRPSSSPPIQQARFESLTQDVLVSNGRVKHSRPAYYGSVDVSQAHNMMQNAILRGAANEEPPITPENSGENALKKALADGWQTQSAETFSDSSGSTTKRYHLTRQMKEVVSDAKSP